MIRSVAIGAVLAVALSSASSRGETSTRPANLVVIGIDTLRADHLGCYGYPRPTSPRIDALAHDGVLFETAVSQAPWTLPAFASIFTGLLPSHHRAGEGTLPYVSALDAAHPTLAATLAAQGFQTAAFVSNVWVGPEVGLDRGFAKHDYEPAPGDAVAHAVDWLGQRPPGRFFMFVHIFDPHAPYTPTPEHARLFVDPAYAGPFVKAFPIAWRNGAPAMEVDRRWSDADRKQVVDLYDAEIHYADSLAGRVLDRLSELHLMDDTLVVLLSDHGEELFDHGRLSHGHSLYDELLLVPLIVRFPADRHHGRIHAQVSSMDLFPTVLDALGVPVAPGLDATSLLPLIENGAPARDAPAFAECVVHGEDPGAKALRLPAEKLIVSPMKNTATYFDLAADPHERQDVAAAHAERVHALGAELSRQLLASVDGFYLMAVADGEHDLHLELGSEVGFRDTVPIELEPGDRVAVSPDGKTLTIDLRLRPRESPVRSHDVDGVRFQTPGDAPPSLRVATLDGAELPPYTLALGASPRSRLPAPGVPLQKELLLVRHPMRPTRLDDKQVGVRLQLVKSPPPASATLDPAAVERLRALGYVQ